MSKTGRKKKKIEEKSLECEKNGNKFYILFLMKRDGIDIINYSQKNQI